MNHSSPETQVEQLYLLVTEAIRRAETLEDMASPLAPSAFLEVSQLEEEIAGHLPASVPEGALARRGAIRAAISARQLSRASSLVDRFGAESDAGDELREELRNLLEEADRAEAARFPHAAARYGLPNIRRLAQELARQSAPLPIG